MLATLSLLGVLGVPIGLERATAQESISLRVTVWTGNKAHLDLFNGIAEAYTKAHPTVTVAFDTLPFENYTTTLTTQIAGGNAPDLAWIFENSAPDFVNSGALLPLTEILKSTPNYDVGDIAPSALALWQRKGEVFAYPFSTSPFGVFVNNDLIQKSGQKSAGEMLSSGSWTWDKLIEAARIVNAKTGKAGLVVRDFDYKGWDNLATIWGGWNARPWSEDGKTCGFDKPEMAQAMSFIHKAVFNDKAMPEPGTAADFFAGDAAMTITQISRASLLPKDGFSWDLLPLPAGPSGSYAVIGQAGIGVFKNGKHPEEAARFLAFMTNPENSEKLAQFFPPARQKLLKTDVLAKTNPLLKPEQIERVVIKGIATGEVKPSHTGFAQIQQLVRAGLDQIWKPDADIKAGLTAICGRIAPLLAR
ncbi:ABC transporter substrate-binding protein [Microvirga puerhi]|uniref:Sugar ABC transporter substrate-binding protein n=1 Tax=Microvirga puerhi TaxID=2876078 RepID=A0ABS7VTT6_9HYPH|nr:sugar ABC transporter substrate-binding protein [Microvirga puerhi]MBZ6078988.1 sugar ABC transporter substrate-binding protein [Microvirga puerhi]